ncbi:prolyl aminopeptidase [Candidatus Dojkabacteria bacterium]|uniref:Proline iminopeptidase n=1 Tax=Candidatus Dojkabacteria bacterium TaxID=2099670 RepID=A0A955L8F9_9BACT|nr:prolyl aminopeptidase [Candidatus Dojkabacteria bacterium]
MNVVYKKPYNSFSLTVSDIHTIYIQEWGNPDGIPILYTHGGPGGEMKPKHTQFFDSEKHRLIMFDQRGCGKSTPFGELRENTIDDIVRDIEKIRQHLAIEAWNLFGGSWATTVLLRYAQTYPAKVRAMILRGVFFFREEEINWLYESGAASIFPEFWEVFEAPIPNEYSKNNIDFYKEEILEKELPDQNIVKHFWCWEAGISDVSDKNPEIDFPDEVTELDILMAKLFLHYVKHKSFMKDGELLEKSAIDKIRSIPTTLIHGRFDMVCPVKNAFDLHKVWPEMKLVIIPLGGHAAENPHMRKRLIKEIENLR